MKDPLARFEDAVLIDTEFLPEPGEPVIPLCVVWRSFRTKETHRRWVTELEPSPPYPTGKNVLIVGYYLPAELGFHRAMGWSTPERMVDLCVEFKNLFNCLETIVDLKPELKGDEKFGSRSQRGALLQFGLGGITSKKEMEGLIERELERIKRGRSYSYNVSEREVFLETCERDIDGLDKLFRVMLPRLDIPRAIYRARYQNCVAAMEELGIPVDVPLLDRLRERFPAIREELISRVDAPFGVYDGTTFRRKEFERLLRELGIAWPRYSNGALILEEDTVSDMCKLHPVLTPLKELRNSLSKFRANDWKVGRDGFVRTQLWSFSTKTSRNAPSSTAFPFSTNKWERSLIKPPPGSAVAYGDFKCMEIGVAAYLSGDTALQTAYQSDDVYLGFAKLAGTVPPDATKESHPYERDLYKTVMLAIGFGMEERSLAVRIGQPLLVARRLLQQHRDIFWRYWQWSDNRVHRAMLTGTTFTVFGWMYHVAKNPNLRSIRNFPIQANAAEIMRLAICYCIESGLKICCSVHDAALLLSPLETFDSDIEKMRGFMERASEVVLGGFKLKTEFIVARYPDRYVDPRGAPFWKVITELL